VLVARAGRADARPAWWLAGVVMLAGQVVPFAGCGGAVVAGLGVLEGLLQNRKTENPPHEM
jgi:hypothetical protein